MPMTWSPDSASSSATCSPPGPIPTTTASTSTGLQPAPVGHLDRSHDRGADVQLDLVMVPERELGGIARVDARLLARRGEEHGHGPGGGPDLGTAQRDPPLLEELTQRE